MSRRRRGGRTNVGDHIGAAVFGGFLGALGSGIATLWFTPWSGEELRARLFGPLAQAGRPVAERLVFRTTPVASRVSDTAQRGMGRVTPVMTRAADTAHKGKDRVAPAVDKLALAAHRGVEIGSGAVHSGAEQIRTVTSRGEVPGPPVAVTDGSEDPDVPVAAPDDAASPPNPRNTV